MTRQTFLQLAAGAGVALAPCATALADAPEYRFEVQGGLYFAWVDTQVRLDSSQGDLGTSLDLENNLGVSDNDVSPYISGAFRFNDRHRIDGGFLYLKRDGFAQTDIRIDFGDEVFEAQAELNTVFNNKVYWAAYTYSFIHDEQKEIGFRIGFNIMDINTRIESANDQLISESGQLSAPLPVLGGFGRYHFTEKVSFEGDLGWFGISVGDIDGSWWVINAGLMFHITDQFGIGASYFYNRVNMDLSGDEFTGKFKYSYQGPLLSARVRF